MKCKYCGMYLENVDEESPHGMAHTIKCQTKRIHELENEKAAQTGIKPHDNYKTINHEGYKHGFEKYVKECYGDGMQR